MSTTVNTTLFLARERPLATRTADGQFQLALLTMEPIQAGMKEAWRLYWLGDEARAWWAANSATLQPGQPLAVTLTRLRAIATTRAPEIHARVVSLALAPWRHEAAANQAAPSAERAAA